MEAVRVADVQDPDNIRALLQAFGGEDAFVHSLSDSGQGFRLRRPRLLCALRPGAAHGEPTLA